MDLFYLGSGIYLIFVLILCGFIDLFLCIFDVSLYGFCSQEFQLDFCWQVLLALCNNTQYGI